ncbi:MAG: ORF6N domain-containing protein [Terriglobales bacterium]
MFEVAICDLKDSFFSFVRFPGRAPNDGVSVSSHSERPLITASAGYDRYHGRMQITSPKTGRTRRSLAIRRKVSAVSIDLRILILRHQKVILDTALAELYSVPVKRLNEQIKRNRKRFPADFMFHLTPRENKSLRSQFATSNIGRGGRRSLPYAFTEHGAIMAATVLNSEQAVEMSVYVVRAFIRLRAALTANRELAGRIEELEKHLETHDGAIQEIIKVIKKLMNPSPSRRSKIGFALPPTRTA